MHQLWRKKTKNMFFFFLPSLFFFKIFCNGARRYNEVPLRNNSYYQSIKKIFRHLYETNCRPAPWLFCFQILETLESLRIQNVVLFHHFCVKPQCEWLRYVVQAEKSPVQRFQRRRFSGMYILREMPRVRFFYFFTPCPLRIQSRRICNKFKIT